MEYINSVKWDVQQSEGFEKVVKWYNKKRPNELAAVLGNVDRLLDMLNKFQNAPIRAGFIHPEPMGVFAVDQRPVPHIEVTRLYTYPDHSTKTLHLITIGNKKEQDSDIEYCKEFLKNLKKQ
jgi:hypothetical protein